MRVLLIEDDQQLVSAVRKQFKKQYALDVTITGEEGEYNALVNEYDLIIIDLGLPDRDGVELCQTIRAADIHTPILILTAAVEVTDKVAALDAGADDYMTKPFTYEELFARIRALMRRNPETLPSNKLTVGELVLDVGAGTVHHKGDPITLRRKEFGLLEYLMRNVGRVLTRGMILDHVWEGGVDPLTNTVDVHIKLLRDKIDRAHGTAMIKTVHGLGYKIEA